MKSGTTFSHSVIDNSHREYFWTSKSFRDIYYILISFRVNKLGKKMNQFIEYLKTIYFFDDFIVELLVKNNLTMYFAVKSLQDDDIIMQYEAIIDDTKDRYEFLLAH